MSCCIGPSPLKQAVLSERTSDDWYPGDNPDRLLIEACAAATVNHKGAVTIYDVVREDSQNWIVMEPLSGHTLAELITVEGPLSIAQVTRIGLGLLDVLMAAHRVGILHCDVKPANVHLCDDGRVVLTDFGIACRMLDEVSDRTRLLAGSPLYTAPERLRGGNPEPASDMFALGATLFTAWMANRHSATGGRYSRPLLRSLRAYRRRAGTPARSGLSSMDCSPRTPQTGSPGKQRAMLS
jgi:serine/threonine protein kinase